MSNHRINFVFGNLNPCGGGERLTLVTMNAALNENKHCKSLDLTTLYRPNIYRLDKTFGRKLSFVMSKLRKIYIIRILDYLENSNLAAEKYKKRYSITINTHGDKIPYYNPSMSKENSIVYCHYSTAKKLIERKNVSYLEKELNIQISNKFLALESNCPNSSNEVFEQHNDKEDCVFRLLDKAYNSLIRKSTVITNSEFSRQAILSAFGPVNPRIMSPPVDVELFRQYCLRSSERKDIVLAISRIDPSKEIEKSLSLAKILKKKGIGKQLIIVGSLTDGSSTYFRYLQKLSKDWDLKDYVLFILNAPLEELFKIIGKSKAYFHPKSGEHFGISIAESMAAGLAPVVPNIGGQTEFVPKKFQYNSVDEAADLISSSFKITPSERRQISDSVNKFSTSNYIRDFQALLLEKLR